jgi:hypothetical protein
VRLDRSRRHRLHLNGAGGCQFLFLLVACSGLFKFIVFALRGHTRTSPRLPVCESDWNIVFLLLSLTGCLQVRWRVQATPSVKSRSATYGLTHLPHLELTNSSIKSLLFHSSYSAEFCRVASAVCRHTARAEKACRRISWWVSSLTQGVHKISHGSHLPEL